MVRGPKDIQTVVLRVSTTPGVLEYLKKLMHTGLYGKTPAEAAERLIDSSIRQMIDAGKLPRKSK